MKRETILINTFILNYSRIIYQFLHLFKNLALTWYNVIVNAVNTAKIKSISSSNCGPKSRSVPKFKNPCGICKKSVNDNQKAIFCITCLSWIHRKCNGTTLKEYNKLEAEDENIPWECILCDIDAMASKFPFT